MGIFEQSIMDQVAADEQQRMRRFQAAWRAYYGQDQKPLKVKPGKPDDNVQINLLRLLVNRSTSALIRGARWDYDTDETAQGYLDAIWKTSRRARTLRWLGLNGAVCGHTFAKIHAARAAADGVAARPARITALDPATVQVAWDPDDIDDIFRYRIQWNATGRDGRPIVKRQIIEREGRGWVITDAESRPDQATWTQTSQVDWPWEFSPIVECQNLPAPNEVWGNSDLEADIIALQNALNFTASNVQRIIRYHAHPKTWGSGFNAAELRAAVDEMIVLPNPQAQLHNLEMQSDLDSSLALYDRLTRALHALLQVPEVATGKLDTIAGTISGVALEILYQPLLERVEDKRETYGEMLLELNRRLLIMGGLAPAAGQMIWPDVIPRDQMAARQAALIDLQLGVSQDTLMQQLGYEPDNERAKQQVDAVDAAERLLTAMDRRPMGGTA